MLLLSLFPPISFYLIFVSPCLPSFYLPRIGFSCPPFFYALFFCLCPSLFSFSLSYLNTPKLDFWSLLSFLSEPHPTLLLCFKSSLAFPVSFTFLPPHDSAYSKILSLSSVFIFSLHALFLLLLSCSLLLFPLISSLPLSSYVLSCPPPTPSPGLFCLYPHFSPFLLPFSVLPLFLCLLF